MSFYANFSNCIIIAENFNKEESHQQRSDKDEAEDVECEEVKVEPDSKHNEASDCKEASPIEKISLEQETRKEITPVPKANKTKAEGQIGTTNKDYSKSPLIRFIIQKDKAQSILSWLHVMMDEISTPKEKLFYLRAVYEAGYFTKRIPYDPYVEEFGFIVRSRYFDWMGIKLNYDRKDIDDIIEQFDF